MKSVEMVGKTVDDAVKAALETLCATMDDVEIEVLEEGAKGFLGIGNKEAKVLVTVKETPVTRAKDFLNGLFERWGIEVAVDARLEDELLKVELSGENMGVVIGKRGETLDALQHLLSLFVNHGSEFVRVTLDTENYREKRTQTLVELSKRLAVKVAKSRKNMTLEPMNSYERRIIHATLQDDKYVTTYSVGQSPNRKVVIAYNRPQKNS